MKHPRRVHRRTRRVQAIHGDSESSTIIEIISDSNADAFKMTASKGRKEMNDPNVPWSEPAASRLQDTESHYTSMNSH